MPVPYGNTCCMYHQLKYLSPIRSKAPTTTKTRATQKSLPFGGKMRFRAKREWAKAEKDKTERVRGLRQKNFTDEDIEKWDQTDSPEISDRGRHQKSPSLPSGDIT